jgi:glutathione peroxidase-family protein
MKFIFYIAMLFALPAMSQTSIYDLTVHTAYGGNLKLEKYKGRKILIAVVSPDNLNKKGGLQMLDSIKKANPKLACIIIPADDMDTVSNDSAAMVNVKAKTSVEILVSDSGMVKKANGGRQHPIVSWLTDVKQNQYFDRDIESDLDVYVISESGVLYAAMVKGVPMSVLDEVLHADDIKPSPYGLLKQ